MLSTLALILSLAFTSEKVYGDSVTQTEGPVTIQEGQNILLSCRYTTSGAPVLFWYEQHPNNPPQLLLSSYDGQDAESKRGKRRFSSKLNKTVKSFDLTKDSAELRDMAVYFCVLSGRTGGAGKVTFGPGTTLAVIPNIPDSPPSVYKLKPSTPEKEGKAACLFTDYSPNPLKVGIQKEDEKKAVNGSVVVVKEEDAEKGTGSYGIVLWGNDDESFSCTASYKEEQSIEASSEGSSTCSQEGAENVTFETDERLNLLSFTVLGLRVIFLKSVAFNLLFTFRLWSR